MAWPCFRTSKFLEKRSLGVPAARCCARVPSLGARSSSFQIDVTGSSSFDRDSGDRLSGLSPWKRHDAAAGDHQCCH
eukprot:1964006-Pleurochrysis_carterae.AAC.2